MITRQRLRTLVIGLAIGASLVAADASDGHLDFRIGHGSHVAAGASAALLRRKGSGPVAVVSADLAGRITMNDTARAMFGDVDLTTAPEQWGRTFHIYDPITRMPLAPEYTPANRAMAEGEHTAELLVAPPCLPERVVHARAVAHFDDDCEVIGITVMCVDITREWLKRAAATPVTYAYHLCPCGRWQLEHPVGTPLHWITEALEDHMQECIVLAATRVLTS